MSIEDQVQACYRAEKLMRWFATMEDEPLGGKQAIEAMIVAIAIILKATNSNKKWIRGSVKLMGPLILDMVDLLDTLNIPDQKDKQCRS